MAVFTLLETTSGQPIIDKVGLPIKAAGWYGYGNCVHTISIQISNFSGRIFIEGTLSNNPNQTTDWFPIQLNGSDYIEYPQSNVRTNSTYTGDSGVYGFTFKSNILYIRARMVRSYFIDPSIPPDQLILLGAVKKIDVCF